MGVCAHMCVRTCVCVCVCVCMRMCVCALKLKSPFHVFVYNVCMYCAGQNHTALNIDSFMFDFHHPVYPSVDQITFSLFQLQLKVNLLVI